MEKLIEDENTIAKSIYDDAVGKMAYDIFKELDSQGFEAKFAYAVIKQDFTESIRINPPEDEDLYIPWIITETDSFNADSKCASFIINTQENIDPEVEGQSIKEKITARLSSTNAWGTLRNYGDQEFPYGFKIKQVNGTLAEILVDENTWFLKVMCEVKDTNGLWLKNLVCEARVTGTDDAPIVTYFIVY
ncbi:hypothetical protein JR334_00160 [Clostridia bacterium]|nr:hypothetical protein JR334_00160 [Clostridia bacterium]